MSELGSFTCFSCPRGESRLPTTPPQYLKIVLTEIRQSTREIRNLGVKHNDLRPQNMLWNVEVGRVLLIDFERSDVSRPSNHQKRSFPGTEVLREMSSNRKRKCPVNDKTDRDQESL
jgi:serine/threonine protein kinase